MNIQREFYNKIKNDSISYRNPKRIPMKQFLSFLKVKVTPTTDHLGYSNGWTRYVNTEIGLEIHGAIWGNKGHFIDNIVYKEKLQNKYNNYVTPLHIWELLNDNGKKFFLEFYNDDFVKLIQSHEEEIKILKESLQELINTKNAIELEFSNLKKSNYNPKLYPLK